MNEITAKNAEDKLAKAAQKGDKAAEEKLLALVSQTAAPDRNQH